MVNKSIVNKSRTRWLGVALLAAMAAVCSSNVRCAATEQSMLDRRAPNFYTANENAFEAILRFGRESHIPMGLVVDRRFCQADLGTVRIAGNSLRAALEKLVNGLPSYQWKFENGVVVFQPKDAPPATVSFLALKAPDYSIPGDTLQAQALYAWMDIKASLRPKEGTVLNILTSTEAPKWPPLNFKDLTVQQILSCLVARKDGGAWILFTFDDFKKAADARPFWVTGYSGDSSVPITSPCSLRDSRNEHGK